MTTVYRILHTPSGLYFCPSREVKVRLADENVYGTGGRYVKSNLSKQGKTYLKRPSLTYVGSGYYTHLIQSVKELGMRNHSCLKPFIPDEWVIEEVI